MMKKKKKSKINSAFAIIVWAACVCVVCGAAYLFMRSPSETLDDALKAGRYNIALSLISNENDDTALRMNAFLDAYVMDAFDVGIEDDVFAKRYVGISALYEYADETLESRARSAYNSAVANVDIVSAQTGIRRMGESFPKLKQESDSMGERLFEFYVSKAAYDAGVKAMNSGDYENAIAKLLRVSAVDEANYADARLRLIECSQKYFDAQISRADELIAAEDYAGATVLLIELNRSYPNDTDVEKRMVIIRQAK